MKDIVPICSISKRLAVLGFLYKKHHYGAGLDWRTGMLSPLVEATLLFVCKQKCGTRVLMRVVSALGAGARVTIFTWLVVQRL